MNISEYLAHLSLHLVICKYFVYSPGFDENATKCQGETSREKPGITLTIIKSECSVSEFLRKNPWKYKLKSKLKDLKTFAKKIVKTEAFDSLHCSVQPVR